MEEDEDAMGTPGRGAAPLSAAAESALGAALRSLGPEVVLEALPLNLHLIGSIGKQQQQQGSEAEEMRTWMLPLLRRHVRGCGIGFWGRHLLPLAKSLGAQW
jgi:ribosomal RNA-processing protein 12